MTRYRCACIGFLLFAAPVARGASDVTSTGSITPRALEDRFAEVVNVKDFGAKGAGGGDDSGAIQAAIAKIKSQGGGTLFFPDGDYHVRFREPPGDGDSLFPLPSNTTVRFGAGARMTPERTRGVPGTKDLPHVGLFGADRTMLPVTNLAFEGLTVYDPLPPDTTVSGLSPVHLMAGPGAAYNSITNVRISNCNFDNGLGVYIVNQRQETPTDREEEVPLDRQVRGVSISNCRITNNGTITADGRDVEIINLSAVGTNRNDTTYDAISIHNGVNVRILGGDFSGFGGSGNAIMIRNNRDSHLGTNGVVVSGASFHDIQNGRAAIYVVLAAPPKDPQPGGQDPSDESNPGVQNIVIANNTFNDVERGIYLEAGYFKPKVPFQNFAISGNVFNRVDRAIDAVASPGLRYISKLSIIGNTISTRSDAKLSAVELHAVQLASLTGNSISQNSGKPAVQADFLEYSTFCGNTVFSSAGTTVSMTNLRGSAVSGNMIYGPYTIDSAPSQDNVFSATAPMR